MTPVRIQRKRSKGWKMPPNTIYVGRPGRFGNPFTVGMYRGYTAADALRGYKGWMARDMCYASCDNAFGPPPSKKEIREKLRGKNLACWCKPGAPCHADVLLKIANTSTSQKASP